MATINFLKRKDSKNSGALGSVISYCVQEYKTELENTGVRLISGVNCIAERAFLTERRKVFADASSVTSAEVTFWDSSNGKEPDFASLM